MKIAVASEGKTKEGLVSGVYGRAGYFLIFEGGKLVKVISNPFKMGGGGAGFGVTQMLVNEGVELVVAGNFGEKVLGFLEEKGIKRKTISGKKVKEVLGG